jgi:hypothetical protein
MAEATKDTTESKTTAKSKDASTEKVEYSEDSIEYIDKGDHYEVHDRRLGDDRVSNLPKSVRDVPVTQEQHDEIQTRMDAEKEAAEQRAIAEEETATVPPPVKGKDDDVTVTASGSAKS